MDAGMRKTDVAAVLDPQTRRIVDAVSGERLMEDTRAIASQVRLSGSAEERQAFTYIERRLRDAGLRTQMFEHDALISLPQAATLQILDVGSGEIPCITHSFGASTPPAGLKGRAVYVRDVAGDLAGLRGAIAVVDGLAMPTVVRKLEAAGALGIVFLNRDPVVHEMIVSTVWGSPTPAQVNQLPSVPVVSTAGTGAARLRAQLDGEHPLRCRLTASVQTEWRRLPVLTADVVGTDEETFVLLAGHVDSWHHGAMDNGGANAVMMEVGRLLARGRPRRGLRLAFWSGHSHGRYAGSTWYVDSHWRELDAHCAVHLYIDSVGGRGIRRTDRMPAGILPSQAVQEVGLGGGGTPRTIPWTNSIPQRSPATHKSTRPPSTSSVRLSCCRSTTARPHANSQPRCERCRRNWGTDLMCPIASVRLTAFRRKQHSLPRRRHQGRLTPLSCVWDGS